MNKKMKSPKEYKRWRRHQRVRNRVIGTPERPRVCVFRSNSHIYAQLIDDTAGRTLVSVSSLKVEAPAAGKAKGKENDGGQKTKLAREVGRLLAEAAKEKGVNKVAFDRGGYLYHGRVAALADAARKHGLEF